MRRQENGAWNAVGPGDPNEDVQPLEICNSDIISPRELRDKILSIVQNGRNPIINDHDIIILLRNYPTSVPCARAKGETFLHFRENVCSHTIIFARVEGMRVLRDRPQVLPRTIPRRSLRGGNERREILVLEYDGSKERDKGDEEDEQTEVGMQCSLLGRRLGLPGDGAIVQVSKHDGWSGRSKERVERSDKC